MQFTIKLSTFQTLDIAECLMKELLAHITDRNNELYYKQYSNMSAYFLKQNLFLIRRI
jgi:hypothetical protein